MEAHHITCPNCGFSDNSVKARFCGQCAAPLPKLCPHCGAANLPGYRFCVQCAEPLGDGEALRTTRRVVTVLFADICNYTSLTAALGAEQMYSLLDGCLRRLGEAVTRFEGTIDKFTGDGLMAVFGVPTALEQHAVQATYAAMAMVEELHLYNERIFPTQNLTFQMRLGLASGEVVAGGLGSDRHSDLTVIGDVVNLAARLQQAAEPNHIVLNDLAGQMVAPLFALEALPPLRLKGIAEPVDAFELLGKKATPGELRGVRGQRTPLVGRQHELELLEAAIPAPGDQAGGAICVFGEAGIGKSRITNEFLGRIRSRDLRILEGDCFSHTRTVPYSAFTGVVRDFCGILPTDNRAAVRAKIAGAVRQAQVSRTLDVVPYLEYLLSIDLVDEALLERVRHLDPAQLKRQVFLSVRELLLAEARQRPVVLVLDDLHWADELSTELIRYLAQSIPHAPLLLYLIARNEDQPHIQAMVEQALSRAGKRGSRIVLQPLTNEELTQMAAALLPQADPLSLQRLVNQAEGMPFYLEELVRHAREMLEQGAAGAAEVMLVPPSLDALIRARYDRLPAALQTTALKAAVIGRRFAVPLLRAIHPLDDLEDQLGQLRDRGFVRSRDANTNEWTFMHILTHETVYSSLLGKQRRDLHTQVGDALERLAGDRIDEQADVLAFHFSRSTHMAKAVRYLLLAAERAGGRFANDEALRLYNQIDLLLQDPPDRFPMERVALYGGRADVLARVGRLDEARASYERALQGLAFVKDPDEALHASLERRLASTFERQRRYDEAMQHLELSRIALGDGDLIEHARIDADAGWIAFYRGDLVQAERLLQAALTTAELENHSSLMALVANRLAGISWRRGDMPSAKAMVEQSLAMSRQLDDQMAVARALSNLAVIAKDNADWEAVAAYAAEVQEIYARNGDIDGLIKITLTAAEPLMMRGDYAGAEAALDRVYALASQSGDTFHMAIGRYVQARNHFLLGHLDQARRYALESECLYRSTQSHKADRTDVAELLGRIAVRRGKLPLALLMARKAIRFAEEGKAAEALFAGQRLLALVSSLGGRGREAAALIKQLQKHDLMANPYQKALVLTVRALHAVRQGRPRDAEKLRGEARDLFAEARVNEVFQTYV
ncbi:MAG TPA: AAA family ATPase [Herpetosiphonaceae bacterium]